MAQLDFSKFHDRLDSIDTLEYVGKVRKIVGLGIESSGPIADIGTLCRVYRKTGSGYVHAEIMGFTDSKMLLMPTAICGGWCRQPRGVHQAAAGGGGERAP
jgi:flagellum-specific ATP synthase